MGALKISAVLDKSELESLRSIAAEQGPGAIQVESFSSDLEALQYIYIKGKPDLLVIDLDLPGVIGLETMRAMRMQPDLAGLPILALSAADLQAQVAEVGGNCHVTKPASPPQFRRAMEVCLNCLRVGLPEATQPVESRPEEQAAIEARRTPRKALETACVISFGGKKVKAMLKDISLSGAHVSLAERVPLHSMMTLTVGVPGTIPFKIVQFKARVVREAADGCGIAFREMDPDTRTFILAYTHK